MSNESNTPATTNNINAKTLIGGLLVAFGFADASKVEEAFAWQKSERDAGRDPGFIGKILVDRGICSVEQREFALEVQKHLRDTHERTTNLIELNEKSLIGRIIVALGFTEDAKVEEAFVWQKSERDAGRDPGFIGKILVDRNIVTAEQRDFGMKVQNALRRA
jgi:hypothetical protein